MEKVQKTRISTMETKLNELSTLLQSSEQNISLLENALTDFKQLKDYYLSEQWREDFEASNQVDFPSPKEFPHGVLSEDAVYSLMIGFDELADRILTLSQRISSITRPTTQP